MNCGNCDDCGCDSKDEVKDSNKSDDLFNPYARNDSFDVDSPENRDEAGISETLRQDIMEFLAAILPSYAPLEALTSLTDDIEEAVVQEYGLEKRI
jgi:hypothetical protein